MRMRWWVVGAVGAALLCITVRRVDALASWWEARCDHPSHGKPWSQMAAWDEVCAQVAEHRRQNPSHEPYGMAHVDDGIVIHKRMDCRSARPAN